MPGNLTLAAGAILARQCGLGGKLILRAHRCDLIEQKESVLVIITAGLKRKRPVYHQNLPDPRTPS